MNLSEYLKKYKIKQKIIFWNVPQYCQLDSLLELALFFFLLGARVSLRISNNGWHCFSLTTINISKQ